MNLYRYGLICNGDFGRHRKGYNVGHLDTSVFVTNYTVNLSAVCSFGHFAGIGIPRNRFYKGEYLILNVFIVPFIYKVVALCQNGNSSGFALCYGCGYRLLFNRQRFGDRYIENNRLILYKVGNRDDAVTVHIGNLKLVRRNLRFVEKVRLYHQQIGNGYCAVAVNIASY